MITQERLKELMRFDPETGVFTRIKSVWGKNGAAGNIAGTFDKNGYRTISIDGKNYKAHRLAFLYMTGRFPSLGVDHIDGNPGNNAFSNLREASHLQNGQNRVSKGYCFDISRGKWQAKIRVNYRTVHLGRYATEQEAKDAYIAGCIKHYGPEFIDRRLAV